MKKRLFIVAFLATIGTFATRPGELAAQLISPGRLTAAHEDLNGLRNCTKCHQLRSRGTSNERCLECHDVIATRIAQEIGLHATVSDQNCATCHLEHFGPDFDPIHLDTTDFDHAQTGYPLRFSHVTTNCRDCHRTDWIRAEDVLEASRTGSIAAQTFLGLSSDCTGCHRSDDVHEGAYDPINCASCHVETRWDDSSAFRHDSIPANRDCAGCHAADTPHGRQFQNRTCSECHSTASWAEAAGFDHDRTSYQLNGKHRTVECASCHTSGRGVTRYSPVAYSDCSSCHNDPHEARMGNTCSDCHNTGGWHDVGGESFEYEFDHDRTGFVLEGKHADIDCASCHSNGSNDAIHLVLPDRDPGSSYPRPVAETCSSCHVDYHDGEFREKTCDNCHGQNGWTPTTFDAAHHDDTDFSLTGAHRATPCFACHTTGADYDLSIADFTVAESGCRDCHTSDDPHEGQFPGRTCDVCHNTEAFAIQAFDHSQSRYPLDGAHRNVNCVACHRTSTREGREYVVYTPIPSECRDCHGEGQAR